MKNPESIYHDAAEAGRGAAADHDPTPMVVQQHEDVFDDSSPVVKSWNVPQGVCGFAWVSVRPGTSSFARWLKRHGHARTDSYYGGVTIWISEYGQSFEKKVAHSEAMAAVLVDNGIKAYAMSRLD
jgi:hypothetical protein